MTTNEIFKTMVDWIVDNTEMRNSTETLRKAGLDASNYSKIKSGTNKSVKYETMRKLNNAFGKVFNPEWMRGKSDVMLVADLAQVCSDKRSEPVDMTELLLAAKDETIAALRDQLADKDALIATLRQQLLDLRAQASVQKGLFSD